MLPQERFDAGKHRVDRPPDACYRGPREFAVYYRFELRMTDLTMSVPEFDSYLDAYSKEIDDVIGVFGQKQNFFVRHKAKILLPALAAVDINISKLKILDVGCGNGMLHPLISGAVGELHGVDVSELSINLARERNPTVYYTTYGGEILPYADASFDCTFAICVLHHVPVEQWVAFLTEMNRVVKPGGLVLLIEHNPLNPATQWVVKTCKFDANAHLVNAWTLRRLLKSAGIEHPSVKYVLFTPFAATAFRRLDHLLSGLPFGAQYVISGKAGGRWQPKSHPPAA
jgi:ubiquinone/menaquinone biosynthesis C-methylase UbiE